MTLKSTFKSHGLNPYEVKERAVTRFTYMSDLNIHHNAQVVIKLAHYFSVPKLNKIIVLKTKQKNFFILQFEHQVINPSEHAQSCLPKLSTVSFQFIKFDRGIMI